MRWISGRYLTPPRSVIGSMDLDDTLSNRQKINESLLSVVDEATNPWGIKIVRIEIRDLKMSSELSCKPELDAFEVSRIITGQTEDGRFRVAPLDDA